MITFNVIFEHAIIFFNVILTLKMNLIKMQIKLISLVLVIKRNILFYQYKKTI